MQLPLDPAAVVRVDVDGAWHFDTDESTRADAAILPGSFNPLHIGHRDLARIATSIVGGAVAYEISITNVDKPPLDIAEVHRRLAQFQGLAEVWLTHAPTFAEKSARFPGATFIVGADTVLRIVSTRYYADDERRMIAALERIAAHGCRFLVACRADRTGMLLRLNDVPIPIEFQAMFVEIPSEQFRWDICSTDLRMI